MAGRLQYADRVQTQLDEWAQRLQEMEARVLKSRIEDEEELEEVIREAMDDVEGVRVKVESLVVSDADESRELKEAIGEESQNLQATVEELNERFEEAFADPEVGKPSRSPMKTNARRTRVSSRRRTRSRATKRSTGRGAQASRKRLPTSIQKGIR